jgi:GST-like protein
VPTLLLPDGRVMTESAAIILHIADAAPQAGLAPAAMDPARPMFLRWLAFIVAAIYPTFTYGDDPKRWAGDEGAGKHLRKATDDHRKELWRYFAAQNPCRPWVLGETFSALDLYVAVMNLWRPGPAWFKKECPTLADIAERWQSSMRSAWSGRATWIDQRGDSWNSVGLANPIFAWHRCASAAMYSAGRRMRR